MYSVLRRRTSYLLIVFTAVLLMLAAVGASTVNDYECITSDGCADKVVGVICGDGQARPNGCTQDGDSCAGRCYRCKDGTASHFCQAKCGATCETTDQTVLCGYKVFYDCGGAWASGCECSTTNPDPQSDYSCQLSKCN